MNEIEIVRVTLHQEFIQEIYDDLFRQILDFDSNSEFIPSIRYQLHGIQKVSDPIQLFIFSLNEKNVIKTLKHDLKFEVLRFSAASLTDVWRQVDRWNLVNCIFWLDEQLIGSRDKTEHEMQLFLACIPPSTISSSICVVNVEDIDNKLFTEIEKQFSLNVRTKSSNVIPVSLLSRRLSELCIERLELVRSNIRHVLEHVRSGIFSKEILQITGNQETPSSDLEINIYPPSHEEILAVIIKENPNADEKLLKSSINSVLNAYFFRRRVALMVTVFSILCLLCFTNCYISCALTFVWVLLSLKVVKRKKSEKQIVKTIKEYNSSILSLRSKVDRISQIYSDLSSPESIKCSETLTEDTDKPRGRGVFKRIECLKNLRKEELFFITIMIICFFIIVSLDYYFFSGTLVPLLMCLFCQYRKKFTASFTLLRNKFISQ